MTTVGGRSQAFVPAPLPPSLRLSTALVNRLSDADRAIGELAGMGRNLPNPHLFIRPFIRREAVLSSRIEGTQAGIEDLYAYEAGELMLPGLAERRDTADVREVRNYVTALEYGLARLATLPISLRLLRELHERLMDGVRGGQAQVGEFRSSQNWIGTDQRPIEDATYVPPPVPEMMVALGAFERYLHEGNDFPPLIRIAISHYHFEAIHPFGDGNGRVGRLLIAIQFVNWGLLPHPLLYLSAFFHRYREDYYRLLLAVSQRGAWEEWIDFFLTGVVQQSQEAVRSATRLQNLQEAWRHRLVEQRASALALKVAESLFEHPILSVPMARQVLGSTYQTAQYNVDKLVKVGILRSLERRRYGKMYIAPEIFNVLSYKE